MDGPTERPPPGHRGGVAEREQQGDGHQAAEHELGAKEGQAIAPHLHGQVPAGVEHGGDETRHRGLQHRRVGLRGA